MDISYVDRDRDDVAQTANGGRTAGFAHKAGAFCPGCADEKTVEVNGETMPMPDAAEVTGDGRHVVDLVQTSAEFGAPGYRCDDCGDLLATHLIHFD